MRIDLYAPFTYKETARYRNPNRVLPGVCVGGHTVRDARKGSVPRLSWGTLPRLLWAR